jgi:RHS repeat-associated protein
VTHSWKERRGFFTGERWEAYSQLLFLRARYYEPTTGRFVSLDTITLNFAKPSTLNLYCYAENNPATYFDPSGHESTCPGPCPCPLPPLGKHWAYLGKWAVGVYGNADHELWKSADKEEIHWVSGGKTNRASVYSRWLRNIEGQGAAGRLKTENGYVWLRCEEGNPVCSEVTESDATHGGLRKYLDVAINPCPSQPKAKFTGVPCRKDVKKGDTLCISNLPNNVVTVKDHGYGQLSWDEQRKGKWVDLWMGLHGPDYPHFPGFRSTWILKEDMPFTCPGWRICPI